MGRLQRRGLSLAAAILVAGCGSSPDLVTVGLVDPQESRAWPGTPLRLVEVHRTRIAPFPGMGRLWQKWRNERVDTVPGVRALGPVTVVSESRVIGFHAEDGGAATVFQYDAFSHTLTQLPLPPWFRDAVFNPPPEFAPGGGHVIFLARRPDGMLRVEVHAWPDGTPAVVTPAVRPNSKAPHLGSARWGSATDFFALLPVVSDTGQLWVLLNGRVAGGAPGFSEIKSPAVPAAPVSAFPRLPAAFQTELIDRGCTVPQSDSTNSSSVLQGHFAAGHQNDWAVLCSRRGESRILISWGGPAQCPRELRLAADDRYTVFRGPSHVVFTRSIYTADGPQDLLLEHDAIEDRHENVGSTVLFCQGGKWLELSRAHR